MTIFCDRDNRWYLGFLCGLLLLALGLGAIFSWQLGQAAQEVLVAREETVAFCSGCCAFGKDWS